MPQTPGGSRFTPRLPSRRFIFDFALKAKLLTIGKGCQENSSDAALRLSRTGSRGAQSNRDAMPITNDAADSARSRRRFE